MDFNDFYDFGEASWVRKSIKNRLKIEVNFGRHLGIDFLLILVGLGKQVGRENRAKSDQKAIQKCIEKMIVKSMHWELKMEAPGGVRQWARRPGRGDPGTP